MNFSDLKKEYFTQDFFYAKQTIFIKLSRDAPDVVNAF